MSVLIIHRNPFEPFPYRDWLAGYDQDAVVLACRDRISDGVPTDHLGLTHLEVVPTFDDEETQFKQALLLAERFGTTRVVAHHDADVMVAARLREHLGLPGAWTEDILPYRDKRVMKRMLGASGIEVARHAAVSTQDEVWAFAERHGFPVVVKEVDGYNAIGLRILHGREPLELTRPVLVESFVDGPMCHVDGLVVDGRVVLAWASQYQYSLCSFGSDARARIDLTLNPTDPLSRRLIDTTTHAIAALRVSERQPDHAFHAEVFHTPDDRLVVCEIAARPGGAKIREVGQAIFGFNHGEYMTRAQVGLSLPLLEPTLAGGPAPTPARMSGQALLMKRPGLVRSLPEPPGESWVSRFWRYAEVGTVIPTAAGSADFLVAAVATGVDRAQAESRLRELGARFTAQTRIDPEQGELL